MIHRVNNCFGITLWSYIYRLELWTCFSSVEPHSHPEQSVDIIILFGVATFYREDRQLLVNCKQWFHKFNIPSGAQHWFTLKIRPLIFLNITKGKSAANNFVKFSQTT